jgi:hypothetical protein
MFAEAKNKVITIRIKLNESILNEKAKNTIQVKIPIGIDITGIFMKQKIAFIAISKNTIIIKLVPVNNKLSIKA